MRTLKTFQCTDIWGASRGLLCDSSAVLLTFYPVPVVSVEDLMIYSHARSFVIVSHYVTGCANYRRKTKILLFIVSDCTKTLAKCLDAFDTWCLRKILRIPYTRHTTNDTVQKHHRLLTSVGLMGQVIPAEFLWTPCSYCSRGGPSPCDCRRT